MATYRTTPRTVTALRVEEVRPATGIGREGRWAILVLEDGTLREATRHLCGGIVPNVGDYVVSGGSPWDRLVWHEDFLERYEPVREPAQGEDVTLTLESHGALELVPKDDSPSLAPGSIRQ